MTGTSAAVQATCRRSPYRLHRTAGRKAEYGRFSVLLRPEIYRNLRIKDSVKIDFACGTGGFLTSWLKELEKQVRTTDDRAAFGSSVYGIEKKQFPYMLCITNMLLHGLDVPRVYHDNSLLKDVLD